MNKVAIIILSLILALVMGLSGCVTIAPPADEPVASGEVLPESRPEITEIRITGYHSTYDPSGEYDIHHVEATLSFVTDIPCYWHFEVRPVDSDYPFNSGGYEKFDVSSPLPQELEHSATITLNDGDFHCYEITVWDKAKYYITKSDTFLAPVVPEVIPPTPTPAPPPQK